jgi:hypothetical protein
VKKYYVNGIRTVRRVLAVTGILGLLDRWAARSRTGLWFRSLFSIYDLADLLPYDVPWWTFKASSGAHDEALSEKDGFEGLDFSTYVAAVDQTSGPFDLIVVDGRARGACFERAISRLAPEGILVFDNVDRQRYRDAIAASPVPVDVEWTRGLTPALPYPTRTALVRLRG